MNSQLGEFDKKERLLSWFSTYVKIVGLEKLTEKFKILEILL